MKNNSYGENRQLIDAVKRFVGKKVLVLGDIIVDEFVYGTPFGRSLSSSSTPKLKYDKTKFFIGGVGNVTENLLSLGAKVSLITLLGDDAYAEHYRKWEHPNLKLHFIIEKGRLTTVKRRYCEGDNKLLAMERFTNDDLKSGSEDEVMKIVREEANQFDVIIFQDQGHGFFSKSLVEQLRGLLQNTTSKVLVNSQTYLHNPNHTNYNGFGIIFMNLAEARLIDDSFDPEGHGKKLIEILDSDVCVTLGDKGCVYFKSGQRYQSKGLSVEPIDTCGAGDSFLAAFAASDFKLHLDVSLRLANIWAALSVRKSGTGVPKIEELKSYIQDLDSEVKQ